METSGRARLPALIGYLGMASFFGLGLLDDPVGIIEREGAWLVAWYVAAVAMIAGLGLAYLVAWRDGRSDPG